MVFKVELFNGRQRGRLKEETVIVKVTYLLTNTTTNVKDKKYTRDEDSRV